MQTQRHELYDICGECERVQYYWMTKYKACLAADVAREDFGFHSVGVKEIRF